MTDERTKENTSRVDMVRHKIGRCPVCRTGIYAEVTILSTLRSPIITTRNSSDNAQASAAAEFQTSKIEHACDLTVDDDDEEPFDVDFD